MSNPGWSREMSQQHAAAVLRQEARNHQVASLASGIDPTGFIGKPTVADAVARSVIGMDSLAKGFAESFRPIIEYEKLLGPNWATTSLIDYALSQMPLGATLSDEFARSAREAQERQLREDGDRARKVMDLTRDLGRRVEATSERFVRQIAADEVEKRRETRPSESIDRKILEALRKLPLGAAASYEQAINDLEGDDQRSWRGTAAELREALRETLDHLAPDDALTAQPGFRLEEGETGPTMRQKTRYVLRGRKATDSERGAAENAVEVVEAVGKFVRSTYSRSAVSVHTRPSRVEVKRVRDFVRLALLEVLGIQ